METGDIQVKRNTRSSYGPSVCRTAYCSALRPLPPASLRGFTLLELLVALAIFALVSALAYGGLASVLKAREETAAGAAQLRALQQTMLMLQRDIDQIVQRGIRDEYGDSKPALHGDADWVEFTHAGWSTAANTSTQQLRSELQRVAYTVREHALSRAHWQVLDRAQDSVPYLAPLLPQTRSLRLRYLGDTGTWQDSWPPLAGDEKAKQAPPLPRAIEFTLELEQWGTVTRVFRVR